MFAFACVGSVARAGVETTGPQLLSLSLAPAVVDVSQGPATVTVTMAITDPGGGFDAPGSRVELATPNHAYWVDTPLAFVHGSKNLYTASYTFRPYLFGPVNAPSGFEVYQLRLVDRAGNVVLLGPGDLAQAGFQTSFTVVWPPPDQTPPVLKSFSGFSPTDIDLSNGPVTTTATIQANDGGSGVGQIILYAGDAIGGRLLRPTVTQLDADTFQVAFTFPANSTPGLWELPWINYVNGGIVLGIADNAGNFAQYTLAQLEAAGSSADRFVVSKTVPPVNITFPVGTAGPPQGTDKLPVGSTFNWQFTTADGGGIVDLSGMNLFGAGSLPQGSTYGFEFDAAGIYKYRDPAVPTVTGRIEIPIQVTPDLGPLYTKYNHLVNVATVTWAAGAPLPGYVYDVQIKRPASSAFTDWLPATVQARATFQPDAGPGFYTFRARLRKLSDNTASGWSPQRWFDATWF